MRSSKKKKIRREEGEEDGAGVITKQDRVYSSSSKNLDGGGGGRGSLLDIVQQILFKINLVQGNSRIKMRHGGVQKLFRSILPTSFEGVFDDQNGFVNKRVQGSVRLRSVLLIV